MLKNEYLVAKFGVDTAENEPKGKSGVVNILRAGCCEHLVGEVAAAVVILGLLEDASRFPPQEGEEDLQSILRSQKDHSFGGSFSAVSTPIFATKYSFCSIFRDLQDLHTFAPLQSKKN